MAKEKLTYETKMLRHAGRELDKYQDDFHTTPAFVKLLQETTWVGDATSQARSTLITFFATAFANLRSSIAKLDIPQIVDGLEQTLLQISPRIQTIHMPTSTLMLTLFAQ